MLPLAPNLAAASAFMLMLLASSASGRALDGGDSAEEEGGQEDRRMDSQVSEERVSVVLPYVPERSGYYHRWSSVDLEDQIADESALSLSYDNNNEYSSLHHSLHRPFLVHPSSSSSLDPDEGVPVVSYFVALFMALAFVAFFTSNVMAGAIAAGNDNGGFGDKSRTPPPQEIGQKMKVVEKAAEVMASVEELEEAFKGGDGEASVPDEEVREKMGVSDGAAEGGIVKAQGTSEDIAKKEGDDSDDEEARRQQYELLQRVLRDKTAIWSVEGEEKRLLLQALEEQRRRLMGIKKEEEEKTTTTTTEAPATDAAAEETSSTTTETEPSSTSQEPLADLEGSSLLVLRPVPWTFSEGRDGGGRRASSRQERSLMSRRRQQQQLSSSSSFAGLDGSATALLRFPLLGVIGALVLLFHSAALAYRYLAQEAGGGGNGSIDEKEDQSGDGIVRAVEEAAEEIIRDLVDAGHLDWAGNEIEAAPVEQQQEEKAVIPSRSTTSWPPPATATRTTTTTTKSTTTSTTATTTSTATTSTASQAEPESATTTIPPSSPAADLALLPRLLVRNDGVVDTPAFLTANDLPIFAPSPPPPPPPKRGDAAAGRRRPSPVVEMNQGGTEGSSNYKLVATSSDLLAGSEAEAASGGQHRHHRPWVVFSALRMTEASDQGHSGESFEVFREQHHESDRSVPPLAELGSLFPQGKKEEVTIVTPEPQQQQLQPQQQHQQHLGIMEPFGGANLNKAHHRMREEEERRRRKKDRVVSQLAELRRRRRRRKEDEEGGDNDLEVDAEEEELETPELWQLLGKR